MILWIIKGHPSNNRCITCYKMHSNFHPFLSFSHSVISSFSGFNEWMKFTWHVWVVIRKEISYFVHSPRSTPSMKFHQLFHYLYHTLLLPYIMLLRLLSIKIGDISFCEPLISTILSTLPIQLQMFYGNKVYENSYSQSFLM